MESWKTKGEEEYVWIGKVTRSVCGDGTRVVGRGEVARAAKESGQKSLDYLLGDAG